MDPEIRKQYIKEWKQNDEYKEKQKINKHTKIICDCGRYILQGNLVKHKQTKIHNILIN